VGSAMLGAADVEVVRQGLRGPILVKSCQELLAEQDEMAARLRALEVATGDQQLP
jgi:hypothetical protein